MQKSTGLTQRTGFSHQTEISGNWQVRSIINNIAVWMIIATMLSAMVSACSDSQLDNFKTGVDVANVIVQADRATIASLFSQGKITAAKRDEYLKIADGLNAFTVVTDGLTHFPPANATDVVTQANNLLTQIKPIIADETTHPVLAASIGAISGALLLTIKKLGGTPVEIKTPIPAYGDLNQAIAGIADASQKMRELAGE
jgi:hypothetical protein